MLNAALMLVHKYHDLSGLQGMQRCRNISSRVFSTATIRSFCMCGGQMPDVAVKCLMSPQHLDNKSTSGAKPYFVLDATSAIERDAISLSFRRLVSNRKAFPFRNFQTLVGASLLSQGSIHSCFTHFQTLQSVHNSTCTSFPKAFRTTDREKTKIPHGAVNRIENTSKHVGLNGILSRSTALGVAAVVCVAMGWRAK